MNELKSMSSVNKPKIDAPHQSDQFLYLDRWVDKKGFRAFVYSQDGEQKLAESYVEFCILIESGIWFASKPKPKEVVENTKEKVKGAKKHDANSQ